jgi:hypothetical protein
VLKAIKGARQDFWVIPVAGADLGDAKEMEFILQDRGYKKVN